MVRFAFVQGSISVISSKVFLLNPAPLAQLGISCSGNLIEFSLK
jgi:hypothetical protein